MSESERKNKKLSVSHNKSKSGTGSIIKYHAQDYNIFNIKSGNVVKLSNNYNLKKFKSISPKIQRRNGNPGAIKDKKKAKSKSQSRSKTKSKNHSKNEYDKNNYLLNGKYNNNSNKQKSFKEKMDSILFVKESVFESNKERICFNKEELIKQLNDIFGNKVDITRTKTSYVIISFLGVLFRYFQNMRDINQYSLEKTKSALDGLFTFYPSFMKLLNDCQKNINVK